MIQSCCVRHVVVVSVSQAARASAARAGHPTPAIMTLDLEAARTDTVARMLDLGASVDDDGRVVLAHGVRRSNKGGWTETGDSDYPALDRRPRDADEAVSMIEASRAAVRLAHVARLEREATETMRADDPSDWTIGQAGRLLTQLLALKATNQATCLAAWIDAAKARREREDAAKLAEQIARDSRRLTDWLAGTRVDLPWTFTAIDRERMGDLIARVEAESRRRKVEKDRAEEETKRRRLERLAALVREHGDDNAKARLTSEDGDDPLGLLPEEEALTIAAEARLPSTLTMPDTRHAGRAVDYQTVRLTSEETRAASRGEGCKDDECSLSWQAYEPADLTADEWDDVVAIRAALTARGLPLGVIRLHAGTCECKDVPVDAVRRVGVRLELDLGDGVKVAREYGRAGKTKAVSA